MQLRTAVLIFFFGAIAAAVANPFLREVSADGKLEFKLEDKIHLSAFAWPRTLLDYPVRFPSTVKPDEWILRDAATGEEQPLQISEIHENLAMVSFFSDLPSGGVRRFELSRGRSAVKSAVKNWAQGNTIVLDTGKLKVRLPASQSVAGRVPGPILQLNGFGDSKLVSPRRAVESITTDIVESGPLFTSCRVTYRFAGGGEYIAKVKAILGYEHVEFHEEMHGIAKVDGVYVENAWTNFHPTHRMVVGSPFGGTYRVDEPIIQPFRGEDPAFTGPSRIEDPAVEMLPSLTPYWPNGWGGNRSASFWDETSGDALGLFITDASKWQDHEYAIWTSADTLKVKYRHAEGVLYWKWPLVEGSRRTGLTAYRHGTPQKLLPLADQKAGSSWLDDVAGASGKKELPVMLQSRYGDISLNRVKDWILDYPDAAKRPPENAMKPGRQKSLESYMKALPDSALTGVVNGMFHPVGLRDMTYWVVPDFLRYREAMSPEKRGQATAMLLFAAYVAAEDEYAPMRTMLGGHPNFMTDLKFPIAAAVFLFPEHPMADEWRGQYAKFMELCGRYYVRPAVPQWEARGGRFTESIATYQWAFLSSTSEANHLGLLSGARNAFATPELSDMGDYLVGILTSPQSKDDHAPADEKPQTWENGFRRLHPPQGAHSGKRGAGGEMHAIGEQLRQYRPLTAEHLMWGSFPAAGKGFEDRPGQPVALVNRGTNPHLRSAKFTGYGIVMRAGVDTPEEISVFLQQVDKGPNYRWGYANQNGSGDIYYYAAGKSYSGHEREDAGDGHVDDAMFSSNTGVYKDYHFKSIGMNELTRPFYDLELAQFAEIVPQSGPGAYSWPEYQSRSVMLVGTDYIITYDQILEPCGTRFAWNISPSDEMPFIYPIKGSEGSVNLSDPKTGFVRGRLSTMIKGGGSQMALVTHNADVKVIPNKRVKNQPPLPYVRVKTASGEDFVFRDEKEIRFEGEDRQFTGKAGVIRHREGGRTELALFHGSRIAAAGVTLAVDNPEMGISAMFSNPGEISGTFFSREGGTLVLESPKPGVFCVDGAPSPFKLPSGAHRWEFTSRPPEPMPPVMLRTENRRGGGTVYFSKVAGAEKYRLELSEDNGVTWRAIGETSKNSFEMNGLADGLKVHVRAIALSHDRASRPSNEYPVYVTEKPPLPPDGLQVELRGNNVKLSWGEVLGVTGYQLRRRETSGGQWREVFRGRGSEFIDDVTVPAASSEPGLRAGVFDCFSAPVYEYSISAVNGNGEGLGSLPVDTHPRNWPNWNPDTDLQFKRQSAFWLPPYVHPEDAPPFLYPR